eukprot:m.21899 g.21899  ORF g.21899 m.21899 type:complete len:248 (+) comp7273_c0_seq1:62-805(+)
MNAPPPTQATSWMTKIAKKVTNLASRKSILEECLEEDKQYKDTLEVLRQQLAKREAGEDIPDEIDQEPATRGGSCPQFSDTSDFWIPPIDSPEYEVKDNKKSDKKPKRSSGFSFKFVGKNRKRRSAPDGKNSDTASRKSDSESSDTSSKGKRKVVNKKLKGRKSCGSELESIEEEADLPKGTKKQSKAEAKAEKKNSTNAPLPPPKPANDKLDDLVSKARNSIIADDMFLEYKVQLIDKLQRQNSDL